jgi:YVTN family beta-propeller protein
MNVARALILLAAVSLATSMSPFSTRAAAQAPPRPAAPALDYEFFKTRVQPIFLAERPGHARCIACHGSGTPMRLQALAGGRNAWTEEESRKNFDVVRRMVVPGSAKSRLLMHPLAEQAGGDFYHNGGKHWTSQNDTEWQTLKAWVMGATAPAARQVRIIQTNSAGDNVHIIDPATNTVVGVIGGIEAGHGAGASPDGSRVYISDEAESTLDVVDAKSLTFVKKIPLSGHPNNIAVTKDGGRVIVGIADDPGALDVIDTTALKVAKSIPVNGRLHNVYVTPDNKYAVTGSIAGKTINVIDAASEEPAWTLEMDLGIRPMAFFSNPDGSTRWIFAQLSGFNGFAVVDFATRKEIRRVTNRSASRKDDRAGRFRSLARNGGDGGSPDAGRVQPVEQLLVFVLAAGPDAPRKRGTRRQGRGVGDADARRQDGVRRQPGDQRRFRRRRRVDEGSDARAGRFRSQEKRDGASPVAARRGDLRVAAGQDGVVGPPRRRSYHRRRVAAGTRLEPRDETGEPGRRPIRSPAGPAAATRFRCERRLSGGRSARRAGPPLRRPVQHRRVDTDTIAVEGGDRSVQPVNRAAVAARVRGRGRVCGVENQRPRGVNG